MRFSLILNLKDMKNYEIRLKDSNLRNEHKLWVRTFWSYELQLHFRKSHNLIFRINRLVDKVFLHQCLSKVLLGYDI